MQEPAYGGTQEPLTFNKNSLVDSLVCWYMQTENQGFPFASTKTINHKKVVL